MLPQSSRYSPLFSGVLASSSPPLTSIGVGAALLEGGVGVAPAEVGVFPPPDEEAVPVVVVGAPVGEPAVVGDPAVGTTVTDAGATTGAEVVELAKLGTNSIAFTFSLENLVLISLESFS